MELKLQINQLYRKLDEELNNFSAGEKFFTYRELAQKYGANLRVIKGTLNLMEKHHLLHREPRLGIFCDADRRKKFRKILFAYPDFHGEFISGILKIIENYVVQHDSYSLKRLKFNPDYSLSSQIPIDGSDAVVILVPARCLGASDISSFLYSTEKIPIVFLDSPLEDYEFSSVCADNVHGGMLAADYLIRNGHTKLAVLNAEPKVGNALQRVNSFREYAAIHGINVLDLTPHSRAGWIPQQAAYKSLSAYLRQNGCHFTGIFVTSDSSAMGVLNALKEYGLSVPDDVSLIGFDGIPEGNFYTPPLTSVGYDFTDMIHSMMDEINKCIDKEQVRFRIRQPMHVIERKSVRNIANPC